ncbi:MAG: DNA polymerase I, partial [Deltaproteobacteria bacterium]|nr:DNA polymerase I [Deltaproteobacteria bacterium]
VETTSLDPHQAKLVGVALAYQPDQKIQVCYIPVGHQTGPQLAMPYVLNHLKYFFESPQIEKWGQNLKYDALVLAHHGITVSPIAQDSMVASYVLNPAEPHNLDSLSLKHLGHQTIHYEEVTGKGKKQIGFDAVSLEKATEYSGEDADVTYRLVEMLSADLKKSALASIYNQIEMPLVAILIDMERTGVKIDQPYLQNMSRSLVQEMEQVEQEIYQLAGGAFNIQSPKQLAQILFEKLKLPVLKKTKTGNSTNEEVLQKLAGQHPLPQKILAFRELAKLKSTYVDALLAQCDPKTSRVHTSFNQTIAETGRLSSSNPNLQNIPIRSAMGQKIREAFIAKEGCVLLACDYSQIELRLLAHMSQDPALLDAFGHNRDVHVQTASEVFGVPETQVTPELRRMAKTINFGLMYGLSAFGLSQQLEISQSEAKAYIDRYFQRYAHVEKFLRTLIERARERGFSETLLGRRRYLTEIKSANPQMRAFSERMAINTPVQGTAADLIKLAMIGISKYLKTNELGSKMILQVHDELVFEVPQDELQRLQEQVVLQMMHAISLSVPLKVDVKTGKNWGCCKVMDSPTFL